MIVILHPLGNCRYHYRCIYYDYALSVVSLFVKNVTEKRQKNKEHDKQTNEQTKTTTTLHVARTVNVELCNML